MKKVLSILLSLVMLFSLTAGLNLTAKADVSKGWCGDDVEFFLDSSTGVLTVSGKGKMFDYSENTHDYSPFYENSKIKSVIINSGVTNIGAEVFEGCDKLTSVTIPNSVKEICHYAFASCISLSDVIIPNGVSTIASGAFYSCKGLKSVTIPDSVKTIESWAFYSCSSLENLVIPNSVETIDSFSFNYCSSLKNVTIPSSVKSLGRNDCYDGLNVAFFECENLKSIDVDKDNQYYSSVDGVLFNKDKTELIQYPLGKSEKTYNVPNGVTTIGSYAFYDYKNLTKITIPKSVINIEVFPF